MVNLSLVGCWHPILLLLSAAMGKYLRCKCFSQHYVPVTDISTSWKVASYFESLVVPLSFDATNQSVVSVLNRQIFIEVRTDRDNIDSYESKPILCSRRGIVIDVTDYSRRLGVKERIKATLILTHLIIIIVATAKVISRTCPCWRGIIIFNASMLIILFIYTSAAIRWDVDSVWFS
jgi:hypothetical protein